MDRKSPASIIQLVTVLVIITSSCQFFISMHDEKHLSIMIQWSMQLLSSGSKRPRGLGCFVRNRLAYTLSLTAVCMSKGSQTGKILYSVRLVMCYRGCLLLVGDLIKISGVPDNQGGRKRGTQRQRWLEA